METEELRDEHSDERGILRKVWDGTLEVLSTITFGPRGWHSQYGKSEYYRVRALEGMECEIGPMHHGHSNTPSGWWWRVRRGWATVSSGYLADRGCFNMLRAAKHVEAEVRRIHRSITSTIPLWEVGSNNDHRVRQLSGLTLRFSPESWAQSADDRGWHWRWAILKGEKFLESDIYRSSRHFDFAEVACFVEEKAREHVFKLGTYR